ncbi:MULTISPECIES: hypothetical protein [unclassified Bacillus (in: firmicutes)]|uniref:hypothetical protein n=1 Tax=unclassified Bacillus (in: firmicutes) TaxID=185979 RepID=UPI0008F1B1B5|nr:MULTISPECIES: hypothetical protein [unclassified Bacillus (in: firmicutes)]SFI36523.1 hypothetical protein SAMN04488574_102470 [Bacillus sp. 71mf]SFT24376.1 hypothetical protein SAMN04488145_1377 [Bacillus sp. 103mf]SFT24667.1 hypothetical protein SAMN04488145_1404 [Bacillus sp. 103mf]
MESQFYEVIRFYEEKISNFQLFSKRNLWIIFYCIGLVALFILAFLGPKSMTGQLLLIILVLSLAILQFMFIYNIEKEFGNLKDLGFKEKVKKCSYSLLNTRFLLCFNDGKSVREKKVNDLRMFLKEEGLYSKEYLDEYIKLLEKEYQSRFSSGTSLYLLISFFVSIWTFFIQVVCNPQELVKSNNLDFLYVKSIIIMLIIILFVTYASFKICVAFLKPMVFLVIPIKKYEMLDLLSILREVYFECFIQESKKQKRIYKDLV